MNDIKYIINNIEETKNNLAKKGLNNIVVDEIVSVYKSMNISKQTFETLKSELNTQSKNIGKLIKNKAPQDEVTLLKDSIKELKEDIDYENGNQKTWIKKFNKVMMKIPNLISEEVPVGNNEEDNILIEEVLPITRFDFEPKNHWDLIIDDSIDFARGVKLATSRFSVNKNKVAQLERALMNYMLDFNSLYGFEEISVPEIVNRAALEGTGQLPKFEEDLYKLENTDLFLIPTSEVPLTNLFQDEIININELPIQMTAYTNCFRKEAGSAGRDERGIIRQH